MTYASTYGNGDYAGRRRSDNTAAFDPRGSGPRGHRSRKRSKAGYDFEGIKILRRHRPLLSSGFSTVPPTTSGVTQTGSRRFGISTDGVLKADTTLSHFADITAISNAAALQN